MSRNEKLLEALLDGTTSDIEPKSRNEEYLLALLTGNKETPGPKSRIEAYFKALSEKGLGSGGNPLICENTSVVLSSVDVSCVLSVT